MTGPPSPEQVAAAAARRAEKKREKHDVSLRTGWIHEGRERPPEEYLGLGVVVRDGKVLEWSTTVVRELGQLAGAEAGIAGSVKTRGATSAAVMTVTLGAAGAVAALARRGTKPFAYVIFPDGTLHQSELTDNKVAARAQADVLRFNAIAAAAEPTS